MSTRSKRTWNWCHKCWQPVDVHADSHDGTEVRCLGCRRLMVVVELTDGSFLLEVRRERRRA